MLDVGTRQQVRKHVRTKCLHAVIPCKYKGIGCDTELKRENMAAHEQDGKLLHKALETVHKAQETINSQQTAIDSLQATIKSLLSKEKVLKNKEQNTRRKRKPTRNLNPHPSTPILMDITWH